MLTKKELEQEKKEIDKLIAVLDTSPRTTEGRILKKYILLESINKTKKEIDKIGIRQPNGNKYQVEHITKLILEGAAGEEETINDLAYRVHKANKKQGAFKGGGSYAKSLLYR